MLETTNDKSLIYRRESKTNAHNLLLLDNLNSRAYNFKES